jgi:hypothetical protein
MIHIFWDLSSNGICYQSQSLQITTVVYILVTLFMKFVFPGIKGREREADYSPSSSTRRHERCSNFPDPLYVFMSRRLIN